ncbi:MAG TPA: hypothetical protein VJB88_15440 [Vicinamibacteria bacterium]|nr:hypothetical protein [Vicinamibacteria bacterium]
MKPARLRETGRECYNLVKTLSGKFVKKSLKLEPDPVIEVYKKDIDRTLIRENLKLSVEERLLKLMELQRFARELRRAGREMRKTS